MNGQAIHEVSRASLEGTISFPEVVAKLVEEGVKYYHGDQHTEWFPGAEPKKSIKT